MTVPLPRRAKIFTKPSSTAIILARGLVDSFMVMPVNIAGSASTSDWEMPTEAISGDVKMLDATSSVRSGWTVSPRMWATAIRPCIAATEARGSTPVQSPAA